MAETDSEIRFTNVFSAEEVAAVEAVDRSVQELGEDFCRTGCWRASQDICGQFVETVDLADGGQESSVGCMRTKDCGDKAMLKVASGNQKNSVTMIARDPSFVGFHDFMAAAMARRPGKAAS